VWTLVSVWGAIWTWEHFAVNWQLRLGNSLKHNDKFSTKLAKTVTAFTQIGLKSEDTCGHRADLLRLDGEGSTWPAWLHPCETNASYRDTNCGHRQNCTAPYSKYQLYTPAARRGLVALYLFQKNTYCTGSAFIASVTVDVFVTVCAVLVLLPARLSPLVPTSSNYAGYYCYWQILPDSLRPDTCTLNQRLLLSGVLNEIINFGNADTSGSLKHVEFWKV